MISCSKYFGGGLFGSEWRKFESQYRDWSWFSGPRSSWKEVPCHMSTTSAHSPTRNHNTSFFSLLAGSFIKNHRYLFFYRWRLLLSKLVVLSLFFFCSIGGTGFSLRECTNPEWIISGVPNGGHFQLKYIAVFISFQSKEK